MKVTIGHLYPDLFNLYGDSGNVQCMKKRLVWRGMEAEVLPLGAGEEIDFGKLDILVWGGGSDRGQALAVDYLNRIQPDFKQYVEDGGVVLAVCGAFQLLGKYYKAGEEIIKGLDILDIYTERCDQRLVGEYRFGESAFRYTGGGVREPCGAYRHRRLHALWKGALRQRQYRGRRL